MRIFRRWSIYELIAERPEFLYIINAKHREWVVNKGFYINALAMAERHVAQGNAIIVRQCHVIDRLPACGCDSTIAQDLLAVFLKCQQLHEDDWLGYKTEFAKLRDRQSQNE